MKKIFYLLFISLSVLILASCNMFPANSNTDVKHTNIREIYDKEVSYLHDFNEESVELEVEFSDGTSKKYDHEDLTFNYNNFSNTKLGSQKISVTINELELEVKLNVNVVEADSIKLLMVGNSYSDDTVQWVHEICDSLGIDAVVANLFIGGCDLNTHYDNLLNNNKAYEFRVYNPNNGLWNTTYNASISQTIEYFDWDFVSLQQASTYSGEKSSYSNLNNVMNEIKSLKEDVKFIWNMTWAYQQDIPHKDFSRYESDQTTMYNAICDAVKSEVLSNDRIEVIVPNGTAVQNARTSFVGDTLCRDEWCHLTEDVGRYIAGLTLVSTLTGRTINEIDYAPEGVTLEQKEVALEAVKNAIYNPFTVTQSKYKENEKEDESIDILMIANSYGDDTVQWVHEIAANYGVEINIANLYIGGCVLSTHLANLNNDAKAYEFVTYNKETKTWSRAKNTSISYALSTRDWDYVSLQQGSSESGLAYTYDDINAVMDKVLAIKPDVKFIWNMTWAYEQDSGHSNFGTYGNDQMIMYNAITNAVIEKVLPNSRFEMIIPNGTAVQNARTSFIGDNLCRDVYCHLTEDFGRYIAGLSMFSKVTGIDISDITYSPGLTDYRRGIAVESVKNAIKNPFSITNSIYTEKETVDLSKYTEMDYGPVGCAYWQADNEFSYNKLLTNTSIAMKFVASKRFTKNDLPIGSIIEIKEGYQYRPDAWVNDAKQTSRPGNITTQYVVITEDWWSNYQYRAFNISRLDGKELEFCMNEAIEAFSIYVPNDKYVAPSANPNASGDAALFTNNGLDINNYQMYDYNYSNGFYNSGSDSIILNINFFDAANANNFCNKFICTEGFDKEKLPVGSVLIIDSGYQYRPDGWVSAATNPNRPDNVTTNFVKIDSAWWSNYTVRGFNISKIDGTFINQIPYEATSHFRIYVPVK